MKVIGKVIKVRSINRKEYHQMGVTLVFETELGEITRTYNIPWRESLNCKLIKLLRLSFKIDVPTNLFDKPVLFCLALEKKLKGISCELDLTETGKPNFPFNIEKVTPILTEDNSYYSQVNQEIFSNSKDDLC